MWEPFKESARRSIVLAQEEARRLGVNYIGTEHLLLGIISEGENDAAKALKNFEITIEKIRSEVESLPVNAETNIQGDMVFTPDAKRSIEFAFEEARRFDQNLISAEYLLLGLLRDKEGAAYRILSKFISPLLLKHKLLESLFIEENAFTSQAKIYTCPGGPSIAPGTPIDIKVYPPNSYAGLFSILMLILLLDTFIVVLGIFIIVLSIKNFIGQSLNAWWLLGIFIGIPVFIFGCYVWYGILKSFRLAKKESLDETAMKEDPGEIDEPLSFSDKVLYLVTYSAVFAGISMVGVVFYFGTAFLPGYIQKIIVGFFILIALSCPFALLQISFPENRFLKVLDKKLASFFELEFYIFTLIFIILLIIPLLGFIS